MPTRDSDSKHVLVISHSSPSPAVPPIEVDGPPECRSDAICVTFKMFFFLWWNAIGEEEKLRLRGSFRFSPLNIQGRPLEIMLGTTGPSVQGGDSVPLVGIL